MAKSVDLRSRVAYTPPATANMPKPKKVDPSGLNTAPPAGPPPVQGRLPLPPGQILDAGGAQRSFTPMEQEALKKAGWTPGQPVPPEVAALASTIHTESTKPMAHDLPDRPPLKMETVDISQLAPDQQIEVRRTIESVLSGQPATLARPQAAASPPDISNLLKQPSAAGKATEPGQPPSGMTFVSPQQAACAVPPAAPVTQQGMPTGPIGEGVVVELDIDRSAPPPQQPTVTMASTPEPKTEQPPESPATGDAPLTICPHCAWDLSLPDIPEPDYGERMSFLQSILGQKPFTKDYLLLGDALRVRFRTLTTRELDAIYKQVAWERDHNLFDTFADYLERVNRYRLYLQTSQVVSAEFHHDLPDGYDKETNPRAEAHWQFDPPEDPGATALPQVEKYLVDEVYRTESIQRIVTITCNRFNRLVAKLEAMVDNSDFWKPTEGQS